MLNKKSFIALLAILAVLGWCGMSYADSAVMQNPANNHYYQRIDHPIVYDINSLPIDFVTWHQAKDACAASHNGYLATATSADENTWIYNNLVHLHGIYSWLGGTDELVEGTWAWVTGEPWSYSNWDTQAGEPSNGYVCGANYGGECVTLGQNFLAMYAYSGKWYDIGGPMESWRPAFDTADSYVCEYNTNPGGGGQVPVPNVVGMTQAAATTAITGAGLILGTVTPTASTTVAVGLVISSTPVAATLVDPGSAVNLAVSTGPPQVPVPNVVGLTQAAATTAITGAGLILGTVTPTASTTVAVGLVISSTPVATTLVNPGSAVNLAVSTGVGVPNVVGLTQAAATTAITGAGLILGTVTPTASTTVAAGLVISSTPVAGTRVNGGSAVNLAVSTGPPQVPVPNVVGLTQAAATTSITGAGLILGTVTPTASTTVAVGLVISSTPVATTLVNPGSAVNLAVSTGPPQVPVPNVVGLTQAAATTSITGAGLILGTVTPTASTTVAVGLVISSTPVAATLVNPGSAVNLAVSTGVGVPDVVGMTQAAATTAITGAGLILGTVTPTASTTVAVGLVISSTPVAATRVNGGSAVDLAVSTGVGVPNVVGLTQAAATTAITGAGLILGTVTPTASTTVAVGLVISSTPVAGTRVNGGSAVNLAVSTGVGVPDVVGLSQAAATTAITGAGLILGTVTPQPSSTVANGFVISSTPVAATRVNGGSAVNLVVSSGPAPVPVPNVVGLTQAAATTAITGAGLILGTVTPTASTTVAVGLVISSTPVATTLVNPGSAVNLAVSTGVGVPDVVGLSQAAATTAITGAGLILGTVTPQPSSTVANGFVISSTPVAATRVNGGSAVNLVVSSGPAPVPVPNVVGMTQAAATTAITGAGLILGTVTPTASTTVAVGLVISSTPVATTLVNPGSAVNLAVSTGVGVPDVVGLSQAAATTAITGAGLILGTVTPQPSSTVANGFVISSTPVAATRVNGGSAVNLVVSSGPAPVPVPNVVGMTQAAATTAITGAGLILGTVTPTASTTVAVGLVISSTPVATTLVNPGSAVNLAVSTGVGVPDVVGLSQAAATTAITGAGLILGTVTPQPSSTVANGFVISSTPVAATRVNGGSAVNLVVSSGPAPVPVPNVVGMTQAAATTAITGAGLILGTVTPTASTTVAVGLVISSTPVATTLVNPGSAVNLAVSTGVGVPNVVGLTQAAATTAITGAGLILGTVTPQPSSTVATGLVISSTPVAATRVNGGSAVNLVVSTGPAPVPVPNVVGMTQAAATTAITGAGLILGTVTPTASTTVAVGLVISSTPVATTLVNPGSAVNLAVSTGPPQVPVPNVVGLTQAAATTAITGAGLILGTVTPTASTTVAVGLVISSTPVATTLVNPGSAVNLAVSTGVGVPNVVGLTQAAATTAITGAGLILGTVTPQASSTVANGLVISSTPVAATRVNGGSAVNLIVSTGPVMVNVPNVVGQTQAAATTTVTGAGLLVSINAQSSATVAAGLVISTTPIAGTSVATGSTVIVAVSTGPVPPVTVPNVVGMTQGVAATTLAMAQLTVGTVTPQSSATVPSGEVISQNPTAGSSAANGSAVNLVVSTGPVMVNVPNVVGETQAAATTAITGAGLIVGTVTPTASTTVPSGSVISTTPTAGTSVATGSAVNLVVSTGPQMVSVPNVVAMTRTAATTALTRAGLSSGIITTQKSITVPAGSVVSQSPAAGASIAMGSTVDLVVSGGPPPPVKVPNVVGEPQAAAETALTDALFTIGAVTTQASGTVPAGSVISQNPAAGVKAPAGSAVSLVVSTGPLDIEIQTDVTSLTVPEAGTGQVQVRLDSQPPSDIVVAASLVTGDPDIYIFSGATLTFTPSNWDTYQTVQIAALPDEDMLDDTATLRLTSSMLETVEVPVTEIDGGSCSSLFALPDMNGDGVNDFAVLQFNSATSTYSILIKDGATKKNIRALSISAVQRPVSIAVLNDGGASTLAVLESNLSNGVVRCELINASTGARSIPAKFDPANTPKALATLPDMNGNGSTELAVLGVGADGSSSAEIRDSLTGALVQEVPFGKLRPYAFCSIPGLTANSSGLAFVYKNQIGSFAAMIRDAVSSKFVRTITLRSDYTPTAMKLIPDLNGNSSAEIAVLGFESTANKAAVQVRDSLTGVQIRFIPFGLVKTSSFIAMRDWDLNGASDLAAVGVGTSGVLKLEVRDPLTGLPTFTLGLTGTALPRGLASLGGPLVPVAVLRLDKSTGATTIDVINMSTMW